MKRILLLSLLFVTTLSTMADTLTIRQLFVEMPDSVIPYLSRNNRLDFLDFMDSKMTAEVTNEFGGKSVMTALGNDSITIRLNDACTIDLLLLTTNETVDSCNQVVCVVKTVGVDGDNQESVVNYYTRYWHHLPIVPKLTATHQRRLEAHIKNLNILNFINKIVNKR